MIGPRMGGPKSRNNLPRCEAFQDLDYAVFCEFTESQDDLGLIDALFDPLVRHRRNHRAFLLCAQEVALPIRDVFLDEGVIALVGSKPITLDLQYKAGL